MQSTVRYLILTGISLGGLSMLYFLSLVFHLPFFIILPVIIAGTWFLFRWVRNQAGDINADKKKYPWAAYLALALGLFLIIQKSYDPAYKYGGWDAWCIWNLHAKYLSGGAGMWKNLFLNHFADHADYPLLVPGINGFFMRLCSGKASVAIPFISAFSFTLFIPALIYFENLKKNIVVAVLVLFLMAQDIFYLFNGLSQYADVALAFFFLCALICVNHAGENKRNITLAVACAGCCIWTKNEGVVLCAIFILFNIRLFFSAKNIKYFISGFVLPLIVFLIFKICYAPGNDVISGQGKETFHQLIEAGRYQLIYDHFSEQIDKNFSYIKIGFFLYLLLCVIEKKWPGKHFLMLMACMAAYLLIYVLSPQVLEWHLATSLDRLMFQLSPAMIFVLSQSFCRVKMVLQNGA